MRTNTRMKLASVSLVVAAVAAIGIVAASADTQPPTTSGGIPASPGAVVVYTKTAQSDPVAP